VIIDTERKESELKKMVKEEKLAQKHAQVHKKRGKRGMSLNPPTNDSGARWARRKKKKEKKIPVKVGGGDFC